MTGAYQGFGTPSAPGSADHDLSEELFYSFHPHERFHGGRPAWVFKIPFPEDFQSHVADWLGHKQSMANQARTNLINIRERELSRRKHLWRPSSLKVGDLVLVHHSRLPSWPRNCLQDPHFEPYRIIRIDGSRMSGAVLV